MPTSLIVRMAGWPLKCSVTTCQMLEGIIITSSCHNKYSRSLIIFAPDNPTCCC